MAVFDKHTLTVTILPKNTLVLEDSFKVTFEDKTTVVVKKGYKFDGASIPKTFWSWIGHPYSAKYIRSALIHDILYGSEIVSRKQADDYFKEMLKADRVSKWKIPLMYSAVRVGGGFKYQEHTQETIDGNREFLIFKQGDEK